MKKVILNSILWVALASSTVALAQNNGPRGAIGLDKEKVVDSIELDTATRSALLALMEKHQATRLEQREAMQAERYKKHMQKRALRDAHIAEVKALLTEEQFAAFEKAKWEQRQANRGGRGPGKKGMGFNKGQGQGGQGMGFNRGQGGQGMGYQGCQRQQGFMPY
ncbi:MAG: hypothetical protein ISR69_14470 [Gammaproteobacteria bacterium]|nr:hypothetical protein [Gammaproteobacteria bacterium]